MATQGGYIGRLHRVATQGGYTGWLHRVATQGGHTGWLHRVATQGSVAHCGSANITVSVQQGDPLGPFLFALVLHLVVGAIIEDTECRQLSYQARYTYLEDGSLNFLIGPFTGVRILSWYMSVSLNVSSTAQVIPPLFHQSLMFPICLILRS